MHTRQRIAAAAVVSALAVCAIGPIPREASAGALEDDGRVGVVSDLQGTALVRPAGRTRWSPVGPRSVLLPGDDIRTLARGAHAAEIRLADGGTLVLGPGATVHLGTRTALRLMQGDAEITASAGKPLTVTAPGAFETRVEKPTVVRAGDAKSEVVATAPRWLTGYRASTTDEWMGSLLAKVDGRNVPLSVGYHKVTATIRDQIAETTVEESFVNSTDGTLEGVFSFPLPAGASVSGFAMWIGEEMVEADIVEKERARAIYEDIKSRKKDPGLLEWSGGNVFTASVFPIFGNSEKRIRLRYTQVLPLEGSQVRYRYALRSEMLRTHPLRELSIRVTAASSAPIVSVASPTHEVRTTSAAHSATAEFTASQFTPDRDFEVVLRLDGASPLRVVPHRRGDDGYFMLLFAPPDAASGAWKRELVPEGKPLDVLLVADTSGSMGPAERRTQRAFVEGMLSLLSDADSFRLMACDAGVVWLADDALPATDANAAKALDFLDRRFSLGWSDFDTALAAASEKVKDGTLVVYVGDGIGTSGDADPVALAQRISRMQFPAGASFHAIAAGASYEEGVLAAMAAKGGSVRLAGDDPARTAYELLAEAAQPAVKDLAVTFDGLRTARVYPEKLPNLAAGTQQLVLGRFLPVGAAEQRGSATVTGTLEGKPVRYTADVVIAPGEEGTGNSFLPRLWARRHLDALLAEGRTPAIKDEIVSMSESFGIITPYTSFLVLENDADRELYGVTRRVAMRDGERFFTDARTTAATTALRDEMRNARSWRLGLRKSMLREIAALGRGIALGEVVPYGLPSGGTVGDRFGMGGGGGGGGRYHGPAGEKEASLRFGKSIEGVAAFGGRDDGGEIDAEQEFSDARAFNPDPDAPNEVPPDSRDPSDPSPDPTSGGPDSDEEYAEDLGPVNADEVTIRDAMAAKSAPERDRSAGFAGGLGRRGEVMFDRKDGYLQRANSRRQSGWYGGQFRSLFPAITTAPSEPAAEPPPPWDAEVLALLASVGEPAVLVPPADSRVETTWRDGATPNDADGIWPMTTGRALVAQGRWFARTRTLGFEPHEDWLDTDRGALWTGTRLGRRRAAAENDRGAWWPLAARARWDFARTYPKWTARIASREKPLVTVELTAPEPQKQRIVVTIDTERGVVVSHATWYDGKLGGTWKAGGFVRAGGLWWATEETQSDAEGKVTWRRERTVRDLAAPEFDAAMSASLAGQDDAIFLPAADPTLAAAKQSIHEGHGTFADLLVVAESHAAVQRWDDAWAAWDKARALVDLPAARKPGAEWIAATLLSQSRRGEEFSSVVRALVASVAAKGGPAAHALARRADQFAQGTMAAGERLTLLDTLAAARDAATGDDELRWQTSWWTQQRANALAAAGRHTEAIAIWRALWEERPNDAGRALGLMTGLANAGDADAALSLAADADLSKAANTWQVSQFHSLLVRVLGNAARFKETLAAADRWAAERPDDSQAWSSRLWALLALGRVDEFDRWIGERVNAAQTPAEPKGVAQLTAAIGQALGQSYNGFWNAGWYGGWTDPKWVEPLAVLARRLAREGKGGPQLASQIVYGFASQQTDTHQRLRDWLREDLVAPNGVETPPAADLAVVLSWLAWDRTSVDATLWRGVTDRMTARWRTAKDENDRQTLLVALIALLDAHLEPDEVVRVLREELAAAPAERVPFVANELLARLLATPWTQAMEDEAFALVPRLVLGTTPPAGQRAQFARAARWLTGRLATIRAEALLPPKVEREKLARAELRARQSAARTESRRALAVRLAAETKTAAPLLVPWYEIERLCLGAESGGDAKTIEAEALELLLSVPAPTGLDAAESPDDDLLWVLRERAVLVLSYLATRSDAPEGLADRVLTLLRERLAKEETSLDWRYAIFRLLVALDRTAELETSLVSWIVPGQVESRWRRALGYLLAETGRMKEAAERFEEVQRLDELGERDYLALAQWYLVLGDDERREVALDHRYERREEWSLVSRINAERYRVQSKGADGVPPTMDDEILRVIRVALKKASQPQNALDSVAGLYSTTKDFRVLASLADGVIGHTPEAVYAYLQSAGQVVREIHEEATCDELRARIEARRSTAKSDTDRRALALLMSLVERRASEVLNQPGPHAERALADLKSARQGAWLPGERRLMAELLASMEKIPDAALAAEQIAQLRDLHAAEAAGTTDRLRIAHAVARTDWIYKRRDEAITGLAAALEEHRQAQGGVLPYEANDLADAITDWRESMKHFAEAETWLAAEAARQTSRAQQEWYARRTFRLWTNCLRAGGTVAAGSGEALYRAARDKMERALAGHAPDQLGEVLQTYCELHTVAHQKAKVKTAGDDLIRFSRTLFNEVSPRFGPNAADQARLVAETIHGISGPMAALTMLVEQLEAEADWISSRGRGRSGWQNFGWHLARWRRESPSLGALEPRLLALVLSELERDLMSGQSWGRSAFSRSSEDFWADKAGDFARIAQKVVDASPQSAARLLHVASYLWGDLHLHDVAIRTLEDADVRGALREDGRWQLVQWHQDMKHWAESLPHAQKLVASRPDTLPYRMPLVRALHGTGRDAEGRALVDATLAHFLELRTRLRVGPVHAPLADVCVECGYHEQAVALYPAAISERRAQTRGGRGDSELSRLYGAFARGLAGLGRFDDAVDAASSAVVVWGENYDGRAQALSSLADVLRAIPDLSAWTAKWEEQAMASGSDAPVVRLVVAQIHLDRGEADAALHHLFAARRITPNDVAVHQAIVRAQEMRNDAAGVAEALAASLAEVPRQPDLYARLAEVLTGLGRTADAERALTGLAEYAPLEAEGHQKLAAIRTAAGRHADAAAQWRQVSRIRSTDVDVRFELARSLAHAGRKDEARGVLDEVRGASWSKPHRKAIEKVSKEIETLR